jgi:hypothetical protein
VALGPSSNKVSTGHLVTPDPASTGRQTEHCQPRVVSEPSPDRELRLGATEHMATLDLTSMRMQGWAPCDTWRLRTRT